jgi:hypothetical protein
MTNGKLQRHKSLCTDQIPAELIQAGGRTIRSQIHRLINTVWNNEILPEEWKEWIVVPMDIKSDKTSY